MYNMKIVLGDFSAKVDKEESFISIMDKVSVHEDSINKKK